MTNNTFDLIIIGAGPAGLTASIYASCFHLKHLIIGGSLGGQLLLAPDILNYPGFESISGKELTQKMVEQAVKRGGEVVKQSVIKITNNPITQSTNPNVILSETKNPVGNSENGGDPSPDSSRDQDDKLVGFVVETQEGKKYQAKAVILATGTERRKLNAAGEVEYTGRGVHYCATCEKFDYDGKICAVIGGANSAVQAAVEIAQAASKVYIIYRGSQLRGDPIWLEQVKKNPNIEVLYNSVVTEIVGDGEKLTGVRINTNKQINQLSNNPINVNNVTIKQWNNEVLPLDKLFIEIGGVPGTALVIPLGVKMDQGGYIEVNERLATNIPGIFAAGDLVSYGLSIEQISSAVGLGARAAASAFAYLKQEKAPTLWGGSQIKRT